MPDFIFAVQNHQSNSCGTPPAIIDDGHLAYRSYFENEYGEQWIFVHENGVSRVYGGDIGWETGLSIKAASEVLDDFKAKRQRLLEGNADQDSLEMISKFITTWESFSPTRPFTCSETGPLVLNDVEQLWLEACVRAVKRWE